MARPIKNTVDYFPHRCKHGKTLFILEDKYGNNGYSFWFKLLEQLGMSPDHYADFNDWATKEFIVSRSKLVESVCIEILDLLANIDAIDRELWKIKIIWSQNFVDNLAELYRKRKTELPQRPDIRDLNSPETSTSDSSGGVSPEKTSTSEGSGGVSPEKTSTSEGFREQSKVKDIKEKKINTPPQNNPLPNHTCLRSKKRVPAILHGKNVLLATGEYEQLISLWGKSYTESAISEYDLKFPNSPAIRKHTDHYSAIVDYVKREFICKGLTKNPPQKQREPSAFDQQEQTTPGSKDAEEGIHKMFNDLPDHIKKNVKIYRDNKGMQRIGEIKNEQSK